MITESARLFKELADNAPVMIWRSGTDRLCDFFNKPWLEFTGRTLEQELGDGWATGVHPDDYERHRATYLAAFDARREFSTDYRLRRHNGEYRWISDKGRPFYRADGVFAGYFGSCIDVTDRKLGEEQLREALCRQDEMLREKEALLGEIHHRVRNNLQVMLGLIGLGIRRASDPGCRTVLASLADRIQTIAIVQRHLHDSPNMSQINLKIYLHKLLDGLAELYAPHEVRSAVCGDAIAIAPHDANAVGLIVAELVGNSFKHAFADGRAGSVQVDVVAEPHGVARLTVSDDGPGFRGGGYADRLGGLGLVLAHTYAGQIGARIVQCDGVDGTQFELSLPRRH